MCVLIILENNSAVASVGEALVLSQWHLWKWEKRSMGVLYLMRLKVKDVPLSCVCDTTSPLSSTHRCNDETLCANQKENNKTKYLIVELNEHCSVRLTRV